jgi:hypothetical protein
MQVIGPSSKNDPAVAAVFIERSMRHSDDI